MSDSPTDNTDGISDDKLPEDLVASEDNPLAEGLEPGETVDGLLEDGKTGTTDEDDDQSEA